MDVLFCVSKIWNFITFVHVTSDPCYFGDEDIFHTVACILIQDIYSSLQNEYIIRNFVRKCQTCFIPFQLHNAEM